VQRWQYPSHTTVFLKILSGENFAIFFEVLNSENFPAVIDNLQLKLSVLKIKKILLKALGHFKERHFIYNNIIGYRTCFR